MIENSPQGLILLQIFQVCFFNNQVIGEEILYSWVKKYIGIPFVSGGRCLTGCDCYGLVRLVLNSEYKYDLPVLKNDYTNALDVEETNILFNQYVPVICGNQISEPCEMAIGLLKMNGMLSHVGIYAGDGFILHTRNKTGSVCERLSSPFLAGRIEGWYDVRQNYRSVKSVLNSKDRI